MPKVLTRNALILCPHGGVGQTTPSQTSITIGAAPVLVEGDTGVLPSCTNVPPAGIPCTGYVLHSMNLNSVTIGGKRVILDTDFEQSFTGFPLTLTDFHQVQDQSLAVTVPAGQTVPTPPALQDADRPAVSASPPLLPFSLSGFGTTGEPAALTAAFTLTSRFPLRWMLTLNTPPASSDITSNAPSGITVQPSGGAWHDPSLTVTVTMTGVYLATLPPLPAKNSLVLVGINRRGRAAHAEVVMSVTP